MTGGLWMRAVRAAALALALLAGPLPAAAGPWEDAAEALVRRDYAAALAILQPLAEQGYALAQGQLGVMYAEGWGAAKDERAAVRWYRLAAEQGLAEAQHNLGGMYFLGQGVTQDTVRAYMWFNLAAAQGREKAGELRELIAKEMTRAQIAEAQRLSSNWRPKEKSQ